MRISLRCAYNPKPAFGLVFSCPQTSILWFLLALGFLLALWFLLALLAHFTY